MAVGEVTRAAPAVFGRNITDAYLTQPNVILSAAHGGWRWNSTVNLEGYTLRRGELTPGIYGEGYIDRRHPHTLIHEAMASYARAYAWAPESATVRAMQWSLSVGKGFTPFGTDDPMMRPFVKFPVNHHHSQIIERVQVAGALSLGSAARRVVVEHAFFNGDEPVGPFTGPQWSRVGDSRTTRLTLVPIRGLEVQGSRAFVRSPGIVQGGAFDHTQSNVSMRYDQRGDAGHHAMPDMPSMSRTRRYALLEYATTHEGFGAQRVFRYNSVLAEALTTMGTWTIAARAERTDRPESERLLDPFRISNGHIDFQIIGVTQWSTATVHVDAPAVRARAHMVAHLVPFIEVTAASARAQRRPAVFVPREFYGASTLWSLSVGVRAHVGAMPARMGRYGVWSLPSSR